MSAIEMNRTAKALAVFFAGLAMAAGAAGAAKADETYLKLQRVEKFVNATLAGSGFAQPVTVIETLSPGSIVLIQKELAGDNYFKVAYSFAPPPSILRENQEVWFAHKFERLKIAGPNGQSAGGSITAGCEPDWIKPVDNVVVNNQTPVDEKSAMYEFGGAGCQGETFYVISFSAGGCYANGRCAGLDYYYQTIHGTPPTDTSDSGAFGNPAWGSTGPGSTTGPGSNVMPPETGFQPGGPGGPGMPSDTTWQPQGPENKISLNTLAAVQSGPVFPSRFTIERPVLVTGIMTYHWNDGRGASPVGLIGIEDSAGTLIGFWQAYGKPGQGGVPNAYWHVDLNVILRPGTYLIIDSDPASWSTNAEVGNRGIFEVTQHNVGKM